MSRPVVEKEVARNSQNDGDHKESKEHLKVLHGAMYSFVRSAFRISRVT